MNVLSIRPSRQKGFTSSELRPWTSSGHRSAFTIVELLIVIVVIAILAAISIVAYTGIQQRAYNTAVVSAANQSLRMIQAYGAVNGVYPLYGRSVCITVESGCWESGGAIGADEEFTNNMSEVGALPQSVPVVGNDRYGIMYSERPGRLFENEPRTAILYYYLRGTAQECGLSDVADDWWAEGNVDRSTTGYTAADSGGSGKTVCVVSIPR